MSSHHDSACPECGTESVDRLSHLLFDCPSTQSDRVTWTTHIERDLDPKNKMNSILIKIIKQSTKPVSERTCSTEAIQLIAFGGHSAYHKNGNFVVSRKDKKRFSVSDIVSQHTADFLRAVYIKYSNKHGSESYQH